ncbi:dephospho-CoA kinase [Hydrogenobacter thermophilus TK-6]|uniref:Dephospho-CoA kinase n=1 Tax=Hydrogenobacter thermophilus (strain DSM 6534 / IAM 12695 / TK-6) TaxID=608538 RepID=D3DHX1_HYDTT|nr:dephospho-CoA kinase [Hydrogenobacter thermophilus]ADO45356.1 dephospho-CoA kinase [Hydrogenobacter thermophilus TK-6]BAI69423.1 dephospho-CoA kinase [Hydrogenobacter thermophilus TK-6]
MLKVGLTGNIGCGKSTVARMFMELGAYTFDADAIIRTFYQEKGEVYRKVVEAFGEGILDKEGNIDRKKLADLVFLDINKLRLLESITHKALYERLEEEFRRLPQDAIAIVEASLLVEKGTYKNYDRLIVVYAPYEVCKERAIKSGFSSEDFERRWKNQMPPEEKLKYADFVIDNSGSLESTQKQVKKVYRELLNLVH